MYFVVAPHVAFTGWTNNVLNGYSSNKLGSRFYLLVNKAIAQKF